MITSKEIKIKKNENLTSQYIESELENMGFDVLRWAITDYDENFFTVSLAVVED